MGNSDLFYLFCYPIKTFLGLGPTLIRNPGSMPDIRLIYNVYNMKIMLCSPGVGHVIDLGNSTG